MSLTRMHSAACVLVWGLVGCFEPDIPVCLACDGVCPAGQRCVDGHCVREGESCSAAQNPEPEVETCSPASCCIGEACFSRGDAASFRIAAWFDWTSVTARGSPERFEAWQDRTAGAQRARAERSHELPVVRPPGFRPNGAAVLDFESAETILQVNPTAGEALDRLGRRDFFLLAAVSLHCGARAGRACIVNKAAEGPRGVIFAVQPNDRVEGVVQNCTDRQPDCLDAALSPPGVAGCDRFQLLGLRRTGDETDAPRLEVRVDGRVEGSVPATPIAFDDSGPLYIGGHPYCKNFRGALAALIAIEGVLTDGEACALERTLQAALAGAGLAADVPLIEC